MLDARQPWVRPVLFLCMGIFAGDRLEFVPAHLLLAAGLFWVVSWPIPSDVSKTWMISVVIFLAGAAHMRLTSGPERRLPDGFLAPDRPASVTLEVALLESPSERVYQRGRRQVVRSSCVVEVKELTDSGETLPGPVRILVSGEGLAHPELWGGRRAIMSGVLARPSRRWAEGVFDQEAYLLRLGIPLELILGPPGWAGVQPSDSNAGIPWTEAFQRWARRTLSLGFSPEDPAIRLTWAMMLGWRPGLAGEISEPFMQTGTMHVFAISGLHIAMIALILVRLLQVCQVPRAWAGLGSIPILWFYTLATGWQPSAVRSTLMCSLVLFGWALRRPTRILNTLAASAFVLLLQDPHQLFHVGFQLSYLAVLGLVVLAPPLHAFLSAITAPDPWIAPSTIPAWRQAFDRARVGLSLNLSSGLAASLITLPLVLELFHLVSPVGLITNLLVVPISGCALVGGMAALLSGTWLAPVTILFNHATWFFMSLMVTVCDLSLRLPGAFSYQAAPGWIWHAAYSLGLVVLLKGLGAGSRPGMFSAAVALSACLAWLPLRNHLVRDWSIHLIPAGQGSSVLLDKGACRLLVDPGPARTFELKLEPFLRARGVNSLQATLLSHGDAQHVGAFSNLLDSVRVHKLLTPEAAFRSPVFKAQLSLAATQGIPSLTWTAGLDLHGWRLLHPAGVPEGRRADDACAVIAGPEPGSPVVLLAGDVTRGATRRWTQESGLQPVPVVVCGLGVDGIAPAMELVREARARVLVLVEDHRRLGRKTDLILERDARRLGVTVVKAIDHGSVVIRVGRGRWAILDPDGQELIAGERDPR